MVDLVHLSLDAIVAVLSLALTLYCFRLLKLFKGGIFEAPIKTLLASGLFFVVGAIFTMAEPFGFESYEIHILHIIINILFVIGLLYGVRQIYQAWRKLGYR